ncbi:VOC family protein [Pelagibacterium sp.]|uniref:VOC family protein n=1 Tax=Pelagibacterium sp. TaxID=1967288 RepID=UPI003A8CA03B
MSDIATRAPVLRVGRPTDDIDALLHFYRDGLGLELLARFDAHNGFDGIIVGGRNAPYHLEFTRAHGHSAGRAPTDDNLLVFYLPDQSAWQSARDRMIATGYVPVKSFNPWWDEGGVTFEDPDGYRVVLYNESWNR